MLRVNKNQTGKMHKNTAPESRIFICKKHKEKPDIPIVRPPSLCKCLNTMKLSEACACKVMFALSPQTDHLIKTQIHQVVLRLRRSYIDPTDQLYFATSLQSYIIFAFKLRAAQYHSAQGEYNCNAIELAAGEYN